MLKHFGPGNPDLKLEIESYPDRQGRYKGALLTAHLLRGVRLELEPVYIQIPKVDNARHAYLGLEGTILSFDQRQAAIDSELLIPVELVTVAEGLQLQEPTAARGRAVSVRAAAAGHSLHRLLSGSLPTVESKARWPP